MNFRSIVIPIILLFSFNAIVLPQCISDDFQSIADTLKHRFKKGMSLGDDSLPHVDGIVKESDTDLDSEEFDILADNNRYALLFDLDEDNIMELITFQLEGSMMNPSLLIFKKNPANGKFSEVRNFNINVYPLNFNYQLCFVECLIDFDSRRPEEVKLYRISEKIELTELFSLAIGYAYRIPQELKTYISDDFLKYLPKFDLNPVSKLRFISPNANQNTVIDKYGDTITWDNDWTSVGYQSSSMRLNILKPPGKITVLEQVAGFDIVEKDGEQYLIVSDGEIENSSSHGLDIRISVYKLSGLEEIINGLVVADSYLK